MIKFFKNNMDYLKKFLLAFAVIVVFKTFDNLTSIFNGFGAISAALAPFFAALVIAYMLNLPIVKLAGFVGRINHPFFKKHSYGISVLTVYILAVALVAVIISAVVPELYRNLYELTLSMPGYVSQALTQLNNIELFKKLAGADGLTATDITSRITNMFNPADISGYANKIFSMTSGLVNGFIAIIGSVYMLLDKTRIINGLRKLTRFIFKDRADFILVHASRINTIFTKYIYSRLLCSFICGCICCIVLSLLRVKYAIILGIFIGSMDMIPYFGSIISCIIAILINLVTGGIWQTVWVAVALLIIQQCDGNLIAPKLMGDSLELRPLTIVIVVFAGGKLFGFLGMLLSVPIAAVIKAMATDVMNDIEKKRAEKAKAEVARE